MSETKVAGISTGKKETPAFIILFGPDGTGKTTFGAEAPNSIFLEPEGGSNELDVARFDGVKSWLDIDKNIDRLLKEKMGFKSLVLDSLDQLEILLHRHICAIQKKETIEECFGSYGKWVAGVQAEWAVFIDKLKLLRVQENMNIIVIGHSMIKAFNDPSQLVPYDRYTLKLNEKHAALWREQVDAVLFVNYETFVKAGKTGKAKAYGDDVRKLYTQRRPQFDAKNRYGLPFEMSFEKGLMWSTFEAAKKAGQPDSLKVVKEELTALVAAATGDIKTRMETAITGAADDIIKLIKIRNHARTIIETNEQEQ